MKLRQAIAHMKAAYVYAALSYCNRRKVGCVLVKVNQEDSSRDRIISIGYNGTPPGHDNCCEDEHNNTKDDVTHAEDNALNKLDSTESLENVVMFVTTAPCSKCAKRVVKDGIKHVVYDEIYRNDYGIKYLQEHGIKIEQLPTQQ